MNELIQSGLTYIILTTASVYVAIQSYKAIFPKKEVSASGCGIGCGCEGVKIKKEILLARKTKEV